MFVDNIELSALKNLLLFCRRHPLNMNKNLIFFLALVFALNGFSQDFSAIWNTANVETNSTLDNQVEIPTNPNFTYNYTVDWGDGDIDTNVTGNITHTYTSAGSYTINISGTFPQIYFNNTGDRLKIEEILSWGNIQWLSMENAFWGCRNLNFDAIDSPGLSQVTSLKNMFRSCISFNGIINILILNFFMTYYFGKNT